MRRLIPFSLIVLCLIASIGNVAAKGDNATNYRIPYAQEVGNDTNEGMQLAADVSETTAPGEDIAAPDNADTSGSDAVAAPDNTDASGSDATEVVNASDNVEATAAPDTAEATAEPSSLSGVSRLTNPTPAQLQKPLDAIKNQAEEMLAYERATQAVQNTPGFDLPAAVKANPDLAQQAIQETLAWADKFTDPVQRQNGLGRIVKVTTLMVNKLIGRYGSLANSMKGSGKLAVMPHDRLRQSSDNGILLEASDPHSKAVVVLMDDMRLGITSGDGTVLFAGVVFFNRLGEPALFTKMSDGSDYRYSTDGYSLSEVGSKFTFSDGKTEYNMQSDASGKLTYTDPAGETFTLDQNSDGSLDVKLPDGSMEKLGLDNAYTVTAADGTIRDQGTLANPSDADILNADETVLNPNADAASISTPSDDSSGETVTQNTDDNSGDTPVAPDSGSDQSGQDQGADSGG